MSTIAIVGTGRMGGAFGPRLVEQGHSVVYGSREPDREDLLQLSQTLGDRGSVTAIAEAVDGADMVLLATPYSALSSLWDDLGELDGTIVIDVTNALAMGEGGLMEMVSESSSAQEIAAAKPKARIVKAFNTVGFHIVANPAGAGGPVTTMLASDDEEAKQEVAQLARSIGFETADVGPLRHARYLEGMSALYLVPYLQGRMADAFEFHLRTAASPSESKGVRAAG